MARKLRFEIGDYVAFKSKRFNNLIIGKICDIEMLKRENWKEWGIYSYSIEWPKGEFSCGGWTIVDFTRGHLRYIEKPEVLDVLYGN